MTLAPRDRYRLYDRACAGALEDADQAALSAALLSFALSFDEIIVTLFTSGPGTQTIPMFIFAAIQRPRELPVVNVVAFVLILVSVIPVWLAQRISGAETAGARL